VFALEHWADSVAETGDLVSYYAVAKDHSSTVRTDMYFIERAPSTNVIRDSRSSRAAARAGSKESSRARFHSASAKSSCPLGT
jgi:hypothetical protein